MALPLSVSFEAMVKSPEVVSFPSITTLEEESINATTAAPPGIFLSAAPNCSMFSSNLTEVNEAPTSR